MEQKLETVQNITSLEAITRSEIDVQISTAKQYPRDLKRVLGNVKALATYDTETAEECFYSLKRAGKAIDGLSVRMAEILASAWGNLRVSTHIIDNDGQTITAQGICHDLETNVAVSVEVKRRITDSNGRTYSNDMQVVTGNAASAIAFRNAVLKIIPRAITKNMIKDIKTKALGKTDDLKTRRAATIRWYKSRGVTEGELLTYIEADCMESIDNEKLLTLRATATAINEGTTTIQECFKMTPEEKKTVMKKKMAKGKSPIKMA